MLWLSYREMVELVCSIFNRTTKTTPGSCFLLGGYSGQDFLVKPEEVTQPRAGKGIIYYKTVGASECWVTSSFNCFSRYAYSSLCAKPYYNSSSFSLDWLSNWPKPKTKMEISFQLLACIPLLLCLALVGDLLLWIFEFNHSISELIHLDQRSLLPGRLMILSLVEFAIPTIERWFSRVVDQRLHRLWGEEKQVVPP